jgi:hypothetical protein
MTPHQLVGTITLGVGAVLTARPQLAGLEGREREVRAIGLADLAAGAALLRSPSGWPLMAVRAGMNVAMAARAPEARRAFAVLTVVDGGTALVLRALARR